MDQLPNHLKEIINAQNLKPVNLSKCKDIKDYEQKLIRDIFIRIVEDNLHFPKQSVRDYDNFEDQSFDKMTATQQSEYEAKLDVHTRVCNMFRDENSLLYKQQKLLVDALNEVFKDENHHLYKKRVEYVQWYKKQIQDKTTQEYKEYKAAAETWEKNDDANKKKELKKYAYIKGKIIWKSFKEDVKKNPQIMYHKLEDRTKHYQNKHPEFFKAFPIVLNYMVGEGKFHAKAFDRYLYKAIIGKGNTVSQKEMYKQMDENNAYYVKTLYEMLGQHPPQNKVNAVYQDALKSFHKYTEDNMKRYEESKAEVEKDNNRDIKQIIKDLIEHAKDPNTSPEDREKTIQTVKQYIDAVKSGTQEFNPHNELEKIQEEQKIQSIPEMEKFGKFAFAQKYISFPKGYSADKVVNLTYEIKNRDYVTTFINKQYKTQLPDQTVATHDSYEDLVKFVESLNN